MSTQHTSCMEIGHSAVEALQGLPAGRHYLARMFLGLRNVNSPIRARDLSAALGVRMEKHLAAPRQAFPRVLAAHAVPVTDDLVDWELLVVYPRSLKGVLDERMAGEFGDLVSCTAERLRRLRRLATAIDKAPEASAHRVFHSAFAHSGIHNPCAFMSLEEMMDCARAELASMDHPEGHSLRSPSDALTRLCSLLEIGQLDPEETARRRLAALMIRDQEGIPSDLEESLTAIF